MPTPDDAPDAPRYYVAGLQRAITVVSNDRSLRTFATVPTFQRQTLELMTQRALLNLHPGNRCGAGTLNQAHARRDVLLLTASAGVSITAATLLAGLLWLLFKLEFHRRNP